MASTSSDKPTPLGDALNEAMASLKRAIDAHEERLAADPELAARRAGEEQRATELRVATKLRDMGVPPRVVRVLTSDKKPKATQAIIEAGRLWDEMQWALVLSGPGGVGKTVAAGEWLRTKALESRSEQRETRCWYSATQLARLGNYEQALTNQLAALPHLVIEEMGKEYLTASWLSFITDVINERYEHIRPTVFTTNANGPDFEARYQTTIGNRFVEGARFVEVAGPDLRRSP